LDFWKATQSKAFSKIINVVLTLNKYQLRLDKIFNKGMWIIMTRPIIPVGISFLAAVFVASFLGENLIKALIFALATCIIALFSIKTRDKSKRNYTAIILVFAIIGATAYLVKTKTEFQPVSSLDGKAVTISAEINDIFLTQSGTNGYELTVKQVKEFEDIPSFKIKLYSAVPLDSDFYDEITIKVKLSQLSKTTTFDSAEFYKQKQIYLIAFAQGTPSKTISPTKKPIAYQFKRLNKDLCQRTDTYLRKPTSGIVKAITLGDKSDISKDDLRAFSMAGISHIISISGLHIGIISSCLFFLLRGIKKLRHFYVFICIAVVWGFVALTGFNISTIRSAIMITIMLASHLFGRPPESTNSLFLAGIVIVLINPFAIRDVGFMLTFMATLGILVCSNSISLWLIKTLCIGDRHTIIIGIIKTISCTIGANLFILPVMLLTFKSVSLASLFTNLVAIPLVPIILILSLILLLFSYIPLLLPIVKVISWVIALLVKILLLMSNFVSQKLQFSSIGMDYPFVLPWLIASGVILVSAFIYIKMGTNKLKIKVPKLAICLLLTLVIVSAGYRVICYNTLKITTIGSFETQAIVAIHRGKATVINLKSDGYNNYNIASFLDGKNIHKIDSYINLEEKSNSMGDMDFLMKTKPIKHFVSGKNSTLIGFLEHRNKSKKSYTYLENNPSYKNEDISYNAERGTLYIDFGGRKIAIGNAYNNEQKTQCEFLYFLHNNPKNNSKENEKFASKYVILLDETISPQAHESNEGNSGNQADKYINACEKRLELSLHKNGKYFLREVTV